MGEGANNGTPSWGIGGAIKYNISMRRGRAVIDCVRNYRQDVRHGAATQTTHRSEPDRPEICAHLLLLLLVWSRWVSLLKRFDNIIMAINMNQGGPAAAAAAMGRRWSVSV